MMLATFEQVEIPRHGWDDFCRSFSDAHRGWLATLRRVDAGLLDVDTPPTAGMGEPVTEDEALVEVKLVEDAAAAGFLEVVLGECREIHRIERPQRLFVERTDDGADAGMRVDAEDTDTLLLLFRVAADPAELDGLAPGER